MTLPIAFDRQNPVLLRLATWRLQHAQNTDSARVEHVVVSGLIEQLANTDNDEERVRLLNGIGNSGSSAALDAIDNLLKHASAIVRMQAVKSLRFMLDDRADELILRTLQTDSEPAVRASAAFVTNFRRLDAVLPGLQQAASRDADALVRLMALDVLGPAAGSKPEIVPALEWLAKNDPDQRVRERSARCLQKLAS